MNVLIEASGSLVSGFMINAIREAGFTAIASDITDQIAAKFLADDFIVIPKADDNKMWEVLETKLELHEIDMVFPSFDNTLSGWSERKSLFLKKGVSVIISDVDAINICQDKYLTYRFFKDIGLSTPETSKDYEFSLVKPRKGSGGKGIALTKEPPLTMEGMISQEYIEGIEYSIDVFCDQHSHPVYIVPRKRINVIDGKSTAGIVVEHASIKEQVLKICSAINLKGPVNIQCIETLNGDLFFIEINPRVAGGMALSFSATENWVDLAEKAFVRDFVIKAEEIKYGMRMYRYYSEVFVND